jgi:hypothetical protein
LELEKVIRAHIFGGASSESTVSQFTVLPIVRIGDEFQNTSLIRTANFFSNLK